MHSNPNGHETVRERLERDRRAIDTLLVDPDYGDDYGQDLVWTRLPSGNWAWLRPEPAEDVRYVLTDAGRAAIAS